MQTPLSGSQRAALWVRLAIRFALAALCVALIVLLGPALCSLFAPFLLALLVAWALHPPVRWLQRRLGISRRLIAMSAILLCATAVGGVLYGLGWAAFTQVKALVADWASIRQSLLDLVVLISDLFDRLTAGLPPALADSGRDLLLALLDWVQANLPAALDGALDGAGALVARLPSFAVAAVVFVMAAYLITADYPRLRFLAVDSLPAPARRFGSSFRRIFREAFGGYLKSQLILSSGVFVILALGFFITGQPYGLLLAFLFAVLDFIPIIGSGTVMVPWAVVSAALGDYRAALGLLIIWGTIVLFRRLAEPKILGDQTGLSPVLSLVGIYVGMRAGGVLGMVAGPLALLVALNLWRLGTFDPLWRDLRLCARDLGALLAAGRKDGQGDVP